MDRYHIESPHTAEECLRALDAVMAKGTDVLSQYDWGCKAGDHTAYAVVEGDSEADVRKELPFFLAGKARIVKLTRFTADQVCELHEKIEE